MKVVFLIIDYAPHQVVSIQSLIKFYDIEVYSFTQNKIDSVPFDSNKFFHFFYGDFSRDNILNQILNINPSFIVVSGWINKDFVWISSKIRKKLKISTVACSDTQWRNTLSQNLNCLFSFFYIKNAFSHIWVSGILQYEYAVRLGFSRKNIIFNSLSCDLELFSNFSIDFKRSSYPRNFLFVGRFIPLKGIDLLLEAWNLISDKKNWTLTLIGEGSMFDKVSSYNNVIIKDFLSQKQLINEYKFSGCFVLPSLFEQWGLVIHEAAACGLPIIATDVCGAVPHFLIDGFNGFKVNTSIDSIKLALIKIMSMDDQDLFKFGENSKLLSKSITPEIGAAQLMSLMMEK